MKRAMDPSFTGDLMSIARLEASNLSVSSSSLNDELHWQLMVCITLPPVSIEWH